jgi:hypothetical protein
MDALALVIGHLYNQAHNFHSGHDMRSRIAIFFNEKRLVTFVNTNSTNFKTPFFLFAKGCKVKLLDLLSGFGDLPTTLKQNYIK